MNILQDEKGYVAQINIIKDINNIQVVAGEDGLIKVNDKYLEKFIGIDGYLENIEDIDIFLNGDIIAVCTDGDVGMYYKDNNYQFKLLTPHIYEDCLYYVKVTDDDNFITWGETGRIYKYKK